MEWVFAFAGCIIGGIVAWLIATVRSGGQARAAEATVTELRRQLQEEQRSNQDLANRVRELEAARASVEARHEEVQRSLEEQRKVLEEARAQLADTFRSLAAQALDATNQTFLNLASERFTSLQTSASAELAGQRQAIEQLVGPLQEALTAYQKEAKELEEKRLREVSAVGEQLRAVATAQVALQTETSKLVNALRAPHVRGRWGEIALRNTAELAGMAHYCDFIEQKTVDGTEHRLRPDMIVRLPAGRVVVVDSKVPLAAFLEALDAHSEADRDAALHRHAVQLRQHINQLAAKSYWNQFERSPEFVVVFIPNDSFLAAAVERDHELIAWALQQQVVVATPTTFVALLRAIAYGWRQEQIAESAQQISALGQELHERIANFTEHLQRLGNALSKTVEHFNAAVGSLEGRVLPQARRFKMLGAAGKKDVDELQRIDITTRSLSSVSVGDESAELRDTATS